MAQPHEAAQGACNGQRTEGVHQRGELALKVHRKVLVCRRRVGHEPVELAAHAEGAERVERESVCVQRECTEREWWKFSKRERERTE